MTARATDWSQLSHAYGSAEDIPGLFARLGGDKDGQVWQDLWSALCHQGSAYEASYAALPVLADIAAGRAPGEREQAVLLAGAIMASEDGPSGAGDEHERYADEIAELLRIAEELLAAATDPDAAADFVHYLESVLAFEDVPVWSSRLEGLFEGEYEVDCPVCWSDLFVAFAEYGTFASAGDYVTADPPKAALHPAEPAELDGIAARLHGLARDAGQTGIARGLTYLFGRATCPDCETVFPVSPQVAAR
ncbi:hypothetical protein [Streptomyces sp. NPDC001970]